MTDKAKLEKIKKLADAMYYAAFNLTTNASMLRKAMEEYHQFIINEYRKEDLVNKDFEMALAEMIDKAQKCVVEPLVVAEQWKDSLIKLAKNEESVSEPNKELAETYLAVFNKKFPILPSLNGKQLADYKDFLNKCQQIFGLKEWGIRPIQSKLFEKLSLLWAAWGAEHLQGVGRQDEKEQDIPVSEEFEEALVREWHGYNDRGAATVDTLEDIQKALDYAEYQIRIKLREHE